MEGRRVALCGCSREAGSRGGQPGSDPAGHDRLQPGGQERGRGQTWPGLCFGKIRTAALWRTLILRQKTEPERQRACQDHTVSQRVDTKDQAGARRDQERSKERSSLRSFSRWC